MAITRARSKAAPKKSGSRNGSRNGTPQKNGNSRNGTPQKKNSNSRPSSAVSTPSKSAPSPLAAQQQKNKNGGIIDNKKKSTTTKSASPLKKEVQAASEEPVVEEEPVADDEQFELPSDSDSDSESDSESEAELQGFESTAEDRKTSNKKITKNAIEQDIKNIMTHQVKTNLINNKENITSKNKKKNSKTGILYVGRLPRGFEEYELKKYFEQFGTILNLRVSRNKKTGNSKHYGFIEFENYEVAKIAQETMNNYLIFGHIIKVSIIDQPEQEQSLQMFKNANQKFKKIPWLKISKVQNDRPKKLQVLESLQKTSEGKQKKKLQKLKELGIDYSL